jgi:hypothetical protein
MDLPFKGRGLLFFLAKAEGFLDGSGRRQTIYFPPHHNSILSHFLKFVKKKIKKIKNFFEKII